MDNPWRQGVDSLAQRLSGPRAASNPLRSPPRRSAATLHSNLPPPLNNRAPIRAGIGKRSTRRPMRSCRRFYMTETLARPKHPGPSAGASVSGHCPSHLSVVSQEDSALSRWASSSGSTHHSPRSCCASPTRYVGRACEVTPVPGHSAARLDRVGHGDVVAMNKMVRSSVRIAGCVKCAAQPRHGADRGRGGPRRRLRSRVRYTTGLLHNLGTLA